MRISYLFSLDAQSTDGTDFFMNNITENSISSSSNELHNRENATNSFASVSSVGVLLMTSAVESVATTVTTKIVASIQNIERNDNDILKSGEVSSETTSVVNHPKDVSNFSRVQTVSSSTTVSSSSEGHQTQFDEQLHSYTFMSSNITHLTTKIVFTEATVSSSPKSTYKPCE